MHCQKDQELMLNKGMLWRLTFVNTAYMEELAGGKRHSESNHSKSQRGKYPAIDTELVTHFWSILTGCLTPEWLMPLFLVTS